MFGYALSDGFLPRGRGLSHTETTTAVIAAFVWGELVQQDGETGLRVLFIGLPLVLALCACDSARPSAVISNPATLEAPVQTLDPAKANATPDAKACDVLVSFASVCCGINQPLQERINQLVASDVRIGSVTSHPWGREGEIDLCLHTRNEADAAGLARDIAAIIRSDNRAPPVTVRQGGKPQSGYVTPPDLSVEQRVPGT